MLLWIAQALLALLFAGAGLAKVFTPLENLAQSLPYTAELPGWLVRFIGVSEVAGALGLILPALARTQPGLTPLAALGLCAVMVLATFFHLMRAEFSAMPITLVIGAAAAFVAWGQAQAQFAKNRRTEGGPVDTALPILRVTEPDGKLRAILVNYACHGTTLLGTWVGKRMALGSPSTTRPL
jgi:hypothetical protein